MAQKAFVPQDPCDVRVSNGSDSLPPFLQRAPEDLGTFRIKAGHSKLIGNLRLWFGRDWMPDASFLETGSYDPYLRAALLPAYAREGIRIGNYTHSWIDAKHLPQDGRLGRYRWQVFDFNRYWRFTAEVRVQRLSCKPDLVTDKLVLDRPVEIWLSTQAATTIHFGEQRWEGADVQLYLSVWADERSKKGWAGELGLYAGRERDSLFLDRERESLVAGPVRVRVLRTVTGHKTADDQHPEVHLLVQVVWSSGIPAVP